MNFIGTCPQCSNEIPSNRVLNGFAICECGWCDNSGLNKLNKKNEKATINAMVAGAVALVVVFAYLATWGSYSFEIPFVKLRQITGTLSKQGHIELAEACIGLGRYECAKSAFLEISTSLGDNSGIAMRAKLEERLGESAAALSSYAQYMRTNGKDSSAFVAYARLLENANQSEEAFKYYEGAIANAGETLPVQATTGLVRLLMKQGKYEEALTRIQTFHQSAGNAVGYLNTELTQLENYLGVQAKASAKAKSKKVSGSSVTTKTSKKLARN